ncbi:MAG TPA: DUF1127 domain-containing protein [Acetobacteraceae bacterium]
MARAVNSGMTSSHHWRPVARLTALLAAARQRARERTEVAHFDERDLRDLGVSRATLAWELNKPLWRG